MKVLSCYQPTSDPVTFASMQEPLVVFSAGQTLCIATSQRNIEVYHLEDDHSVLLQTFSTAGIVKQGFYNTTGNYIAVLEVRERLPNQPANIRIYSNWEKCGSDSPVRARIAGQPPSNSSWDTLNPRQFELIELPLRTSPKCLACCLLTGNVIVGLSTSLAIFQYVVHNEGTETEYKDFTHLMDILVGFPVKEVALCEQYVAFTTDHQLHCFKLTFYDQKQDTICVKSTGDLSNKPGSDLGSSSDGRTDDSTSHEYIDMDGSITWNFGSAGYTIPETFMKPLHKTVLSSVKHEKLYHEDLKHPVEILGPKEKVKGHPVQVKWDEDFLSSQGGLSGSQVKVSITHLLYRRFKSATNADTDQEYDGPTQSLQLLPTFKKEYDSVTDKDQPDLLSTNTRTLVSLCCFISTTKDGYMYNILETPHLMSQYSYKADALSVRAGHSLLYALTQNGLEIYTMRVFAAAFQQLDSKDENILVSPSANLDVCMIGLLPWINITDIAVSMDHVILLSKIKHSTSPTRKQSSPVPHQMASTTWSIEVLHKTRADRIFEDMLSLGQRYQNSSPESYLQLMQEGYLLLKGELLLSQDNTQGDRSLLDCSHANTMTTTLRHLFIKTCSLLGQYYSRPNVEDHHLAIAYFKMSNLSLQQILQMFTCQDAAEEISPDAEQFPDQDEDPGGDHVVPPGPGLVSYLDHLLFGGDKPLDLDVDEELSTKILEIYQNVAPAKVSQLILLSTVRDSLSPSKAMESLDKLNATEGYEQSIQDILTMVWLHLQIGDLEQAHAMLGMLNTDEIAQLLVDHHEQLLCQQDTRQLTFLAQLIRQQEPEGLFAAMLQLLDQQKISLTTCCQLLLSDDKPSIHDSTHYRQFLEIVMADKHRHTVSADAAAQLVDIYIQRLTVWKPPVLTLRHSSRHRHVPRGDGCYGDRPQWLNSLPPFQGNSSLSGRCLQTKMPSVTTTRHQSASVLGIVQVRPQVQENNDDEDCPCCCCNEDLIKLQSLISSQCCPDSVLTQVLQWVRKCTFRGSSSLNLLCLNRLDPNTALGLLVKNHQEVVMEYATGTFNNDAESWKNLLQLVLLVAKDSMVTKESMVTEAMRSKEDKRNEDRIVLQTLKDVLEHTCNLLEPQDFVQTLPNEGAFTFFASYLEQSCRRYKVKTLHTQALSTIRTNARS